MVQALSQNLRYYLVSSKCPHNRSAVSRRYRASKISSPPKLRFDRTSIQPVVLDAVLSFTVPRASDIVQLSNLLGKLEEGPAVGNLPSYLFIAHLLRPVPLRNAPSYIVSFYDSSTLDAFAQHAIHIDIIPVPIFGPFSSIENAGEGVVRANT